MNLLMRKLSVILMASILAFAVYGRFDSAFGDPTNTGFDENVSEGFASKAGYEIIPGNLVPVEGHRIQQTPGHMRYAEIITYQLDPNLDAYKVKSVGFKHIDSVTFARREGEKRPYIVDFYLHGRTGLYEDPAILIKGLDLRKFLYQEVDSGSGTGGLNRLQAYFSEFARKAKIIYPEAAINSEQSGSDITYQQVMLSKIHDELSILVNYTKNSSEGVDEKLSRAIHQIETGNPYMLTAINTNLREAIEKIDHQGRSGEDAGEHLSEIKHLVTQVLKMQSVDKIYDVKMVNNCREPGNYEIALRDMLGRSLFRSNWSFSTGHYDKILSSYSGIGISKMGTGIHVPSTVRNREWGRYWDSFLPWKRLKSFPKISIDRLSVVRGPQSEEAFSGQPVSGPIEVVGGRIPYEEYELEVRHKSGDHSGVPEPLSYVKVDPDLLLPTGFEAPLEEGKAEVYWAAATNRGKLVPHQFKNFSDLQVYEVYLSGFDLNGVYIGQSDLKKFDKLRKNGRWHFNFRYLKNLKNFEFRQWGDDYTEIRIMGDPLDDETPNFIIGNFKLNVGQSTEFLFGIGTQPLISRYNDNVYQDRLRYGLAYNADGTILDHHNFGIGVERVWIERLDANTYKIRLISYERILPVWEGILRLPPSGPRA